MGHVASASVLASIVATSTFVDVCFFLKLCSSFPEVVV